MATIAIYADVTTVAFFLRYVLFIMVCCFGLYPLLIIPKNQTVGLVIKENDMGSNIGNTHDKVFSIIFFSQMKLK